MDYGSLTSDQLVELIQRLERELQETRGLAERINLYLPIVEQAAESIAVTDLGGNYILFNKSYETLRGCTRDELFSKQLKDSYPPAEKKKREIAFEEVMTKGYWKGELDFSRKDGTLVPTSCTTVLMKDRDGRPMAVIGLMTDITDIKKAEADLRAAKEEAERANRLKSYFLATMSHEIRTPINAILGFTGLLLEDEPDPERKARLGMVLQSGTILLDLVNDILDLSKIEAGKYEIVAAPFSLAETVAAVGSLFAPSARERGLSLTVATTGDIPDFVMGDRTRLRQIIINIIGNALKFTERGEIALHCDYRDGRATIRVKDSGIGIAANRQEIIFSEFSQADETISRKYGGTGLGLAICRKILSLMGGSIGVQSRPGSGSEFTVELPLPPCGAPGPGESAAAGTAAINADEVVRRHAESGRELHILVSEDELINQKYLEATIGRLGLSCDVAGDGAETLALMRKTRYDIVLLDMQMPVMNGEEVLEAVRREGLHGDTVIIAQTAYAMAGDRERFLSLGCQSYLSKPIDRNALKAAIAGVIAKKYGTP